MRCRARIVTENEILAGGHALAVRQQWEQQLPLFFLLLTQGHGNLFYQQVISIAARQV